MNHFLNKSAIEPIPMHMMGFPMTPVSHDWDVLSHQIASARVEPIDYDGDRPDDIRNAHLGPPSSIENLRIELDDGSVRLWQRLGAK
jgi:hypothetical protein